MGLYQLQDTELRSATFRAYNDWLADFVSAAPDRLVGVPLINLGDIPEACRELTRARNIGLRGAMIWAGPPADRPYSLPLYEPFWSLAEELHMPVSMHILTGAEGGGGSISGSADRVAEYTLMHTMVCRSLTSMIMSGVLARHPRLAVVSVENDTGWLASYLGRLDHASRRYYQLRSTEVEDPVSQYFHRQVYATFQDDRAGILTRELVGVDNLMWGSDFPHGDSTWPRSRETLAENFAGVDDIDRRKITSENVRRLYGLN
jgi:predicted TIM-barrel fold metal-dependent hydrolase